MSVVRIPNFITPDEAKILTAWTLQNHNEAYFLDANMGGTRKTTRYSPEYDFQYPEIALKIRQRIVDLLCAQDLEEHCVRPPFKDGIVASYAPPGDSCFEHVDPVWFDGMHTLHCNVLSQAPEAGGIVYVEGTPYEMQERELFCYRVSRDKHGVTEILGNKARCMWVFGFCVLDDDWEKLKMTGTKINLVAL